MKMSCLRFIFVFLLCVSCNKKQEKKNSDNVNSIIREDSTKMILADSLKIDNTSEVISSDRPLAILIDLASKIKEENWRFDIDRRKNVSYYKFLEDENIQIFNKTPFYKLPYEKTMVFKAKRFTDRYSQFLNDFEFDLNSKIVSIWSYFYRGNKIDNTISDGAIEQWEFINEKYAVDFQNQMQKASYIIYFNTSPYLVRKDNYVFIFHTRAMAFSYDQKKIFEKFKSLVLR